MIVDTSALLAIFFLESDADQFIDIITGDPSPLISAVNFVEASIVLDSRTGQDSSAELEAFIDGAGLTIEPVTLEQARLASDAYRSYGKARHAAGLNFGDCFAYALAKAAQRPLLYKGDDFSQTDIAAAL